MSAREPADQHISAVYDATSRDELIARYAIWADSYDQDLQEVGYLHLPVMIGLVARHVPRRDATILDAGVGTGAIGALLNLLGYNNLSGIDMSPAMLAKANKRKCYADLREAVLGEPLDFVDGSFDAIISTGTFTKGHAPASAFDELVRLLEKDGVLIFTVGTIIWEEQGFKSKLDGLIATGKLKPIETTPIYCPMPYSKTESDYTTRAHVFRKVG